MLLNVVAPVTARVDERVVAPLTAKVEDKVVAPVTARVEDKVVAPEALSVPESSIESFKETVMDDPKDTSPPPVRLVPAETVTFELVRAELGMLVKVLVEPEIDLLVNVSVVALPTKVSVALGKVSWLILLPVKVRLLKVGEEVVETSWSKVALFSTVKTVSPEVSSKTDSDGLETIVKSLIASLTDSVPLI